METMTVYQHDAEGFYVGEEVGYGESMPHNCVAAKPEIIEGQIPRWDGNVWIQIENHKGRKGYVDGEPFEITEYGSLPEGWSETPPLRALEDLRRERCNAIDSRTDGLLEKHGLPFAGVNFSLTDKARLNYREVESALANATDFRDQGIINEAQFDAFFPVAFQTLDDHEYLFNNPLELQSFFLELGTYQANPQSPWSTGRVLKASVMACTTAAEVEAIVDDRE